MTETISINGLTLCHKNSTGRVRSTLPDVCKAPKYPVPFTNVAFSKDLAKGTTTVKSHDGAMCGIKGSEFSVSIGDEPGVGKGVGSGTQLDRATFLAWSPNVFMEGKPVTRLTDRMLMNDGNTISAGGYYTGDVQNPENEDTLNAICEKACECLAEGTMNQRCVAGKMREWAQNNGSHLQAERSWIRGPGGNWIPRRLDPSGYMSGARVAGSRIPDFTNLNTQSIIEVKLANPETGFQDSYGTGQEEAYRDLARRNEMSFEEVDFTKDCDCGDGDGDGEAETVPVPEEELEIEPTMPLFLRLLLRLRLPLYIPPMQPRPGVIPGMRPQIA